MIVRMFQVASAVLLLTVVASAAGAQSCDDFNDCTGAGMCLPDGSCQEGAPLPNGTTCQSVNPCMTGMFCQNGMCTGGQSRPDGTPCRVIDSPCFSLGECRAPAPGIPFSLCLGSFFVECPDVDGDPCTQSFCNIESGQCESFPACIFEDHDPECSDATCSVVDGAPVCTFTAKNEGGACFEFEECMSYRCQAGDCVPGEAGPTPTPVPTPPMGDCVGDCNGDGEVTIDEIIVMVNIALGTQSIDDCPEGDFNGDGEITIDEILQAVNNALTGC